MKNIKNIVLIVVLLALTLVVLFAPIDLKIYIAYGVFGLAVLSAIGFALVSIITNLKENLKGLIGFGSVVALFAIFYATAPKSNEALDALCAKTGTNTIWIPMVEADLYVVYALLAAFVLGFIGTSIRNMLIK